MITVRRPVWWMGWGITAIPLAVFQAKGAPSLAASYYNLARPGNPDMTYDSRPTWTAATGWSLNGSIGLTSNLYPPSNNSMTVLIRYSGASGSTGNRCLFGCCVNSGAYNGIYIQRSLNNGSHQYYNDGNYNPANRLGDGVACVSGNQGYFNGATDGGTWADQAQGMPTNLTISIGCLNQGGTASQPMVGVIQAIVFYNGTLTAAQVKAVSTEMARL